jgi:N-acetylneuraminic acid mutarotase
LYDPATEQWSFTGEGNYINNPTTMTLLQNGRILVTGVSDFHHEQAAIYNQSTKSWRLAGKLPFFVDKNRSGCGCEPWSWRATLLANGQVLVSGIEGTSLYDATTGTWGLTALPIVPRRDHTATLLPNGTTLIAGGTDDGLVITPWIASVQILKKNRPIAAIVAGTKAKKLSLVISGLDFDSKAELLVNGEALELARTSGTRLRGRFTQPMVSTPGELSIQVRNSNGRISNTVTVLVVAGQ